MAFVVFGCGSSDTEPPTAAAFADSEDVQPQGTTSTISPTTTTSVLTTTSVTTTTTTTTIATTTTTEPPQPPVTVLSSAETADRRLPTFDILAPPPTDEFVSTIESPAPTDVISRSTWNEECPVNATELAYAQVSFFGFDGEFHTGEMLVHRDSAEDLVNIFAQLHEMRFPIEQMEIVSNADLALGPDGKPNNTTAFTCRRSVSSSRWSRHAFGDAIDINPFHNPYVSGDLILPTQAGAYIDRDRDVPGLISQDVVALFADIGWGWGGEWNSVKDWMHFSSTGG